MRWRRERSMSSLIVSNTSPVGWGRRVVGISVLVLVAAGEGMEAEGSGTAVGGHGMTFSLKDE